MGINVAQVGKLFALVGMTQIGLAQLIAHKTVGYRMRV